MRFRYQWIVVLFACFLVACGTLPDALNYKAAHANDSDAGGQYCKEVQDAFEARADSQEILGYVFSIGGVAATTSAGAVAAFSEPQDRSDFEKGVLFAVPLVGILSMGFGVYYLSKYQASYAAMQTANEGQMLGKDDEHKYWACRAAFVAYTDSSAQASRELAKAISGLGAPATLPTLENGQAQPPAAEGNPDSTKEEAPSSTSE